MAQSNITFRSIIGAVAAALVASSATATGTVNPADFARAVSFTASGYDGASTLENFPVLVRLSEGIDGFSYADIGATTNAAYAALRFADANHANLDYEIEAWDTNGTSFVWVSLPSLSGTGTRFSAYYVPDTGATLPDVYPTNVWTSAGYVGVWHMNSRNGSGPAANYPDATGTALATHSDSSNWNGYFYDASNSTTANGTKWMNQNPPLVVSNNYTTTWAFSQTGCSLEAWRSAVGTGTYVPYFADGPDPDYSFGVFLRGDNNGTGGGVWFKGQSTARVYPGESSSNTWHFITAVCPAAGSSGNSVLYGEDSENEGRLSVLTSESASKVSAVDYTANGMGLTTFIGKRSSQTWCDELRIRRGVSTEDWIQANYDTQRVGTDFLAVGAVHNTDELVVTDVADTTATVYVDSSFAGIGDSAKALFVNFATKATNEVAIANLASPSATATGLAVDADYDVRFVVLSGGAVVHETSAASFTTTGRPALNPHDYRYSVTFTASGYDGTETLEHFPVLVHLSETTVPGFSYAGVNPADIRFTAADGSLLAHEVETWDTTGLSAIWVGLPALSGADTTFTMHWKPFSNAGVAAQPAYRVWKYADYVGVWHLSDIVKTVNENYVEYNNPLWGQYWPDSSGYGANATKGTIGNATWKPSLYYFPEDPSRSQYASYGRANGTLGADAYTPFIIPPTAGGGGAGDWKFANTGYSAETWVLPFGSEHAVFASGQSVSTSADNFTRVSTNLVRIAANDWGASSSGWNNEKTSEKIWHFVTTVWTPTSSADLTLLYGTSGDGAPSVRQTRNCHATDQFATEGMRFTAGTGQDYGVDEMRIRRGLSTADWIQANWDTQRVGTDFLTAGEIVNRQGATTVIFR